MRWEGREAFINSRKGFTLIELLLVVVATTSLLVSSCQIDSSSGSKSAS
jgi:prepilin-type N-terminal cleavage/methylation domain-containing protein